MCDFFIFPLWCGTWDHVRSLGPELMQCPRCHNNAIQTIRRRRWMTLYCIPVFPISRRRQLFHCDICRWEGIPLGTVQMRQENGRHRHHHRQLEEEQHQSDSSTNRQNRDLYIPRSSSQGALHTSNSLSQTSPPTQSHFQSVPYSTNDYQAPPPPPPPYTKTPS
ncbi:hypothetical protein COEREDRAFT_7858 [Coemansia reversa NRRL 1564]|uniref:Zinc-ribbon 15 domain-containing protein n=1 Tax=Coemansia reversa (strain ATCC 12441 / NRRL 1564) TaxID=763665 RepID=A0A2G5BDK7_COERN|nr:hypothetical protein COEREDRAFT_7858 [Coemansia reversa NRRL 1564]|eukprot:PIA17091.1 hypothetical protein COEREDRAFT_7858 [Coemansia reversa NRRL 1564]